MESPPQNAGSDCEDGEVSSSEDEGVEKDSVEEAPKHSSKGATRQREEENDEDMSPQRKVFPQEFRISPYFHIFLLPSFVFRNTHLHFCYDHPGFSIITHFCNPFSFSDIC